jgi:phosphate transport system substrate-binding protein
MRIPSIALFALCALMSGCGGESQVLNGAGATFPYPIYSKWFSDYAAQTGVKINYQSIGSGGGIKQLQDGIVDFGASDGPMTDKEIAAAKHGMVLHFPTVLGAVVITYNVPAVTTPLQLSGEVISDIFMGRVTKWNDARLTALNPGVSLPANDIIVVHRSDGSGTTYVFTDYLASASPAWTVDGGGPGRGKEVQWPVGLGGKGNEGVAGQVKQTAMSLGYVELAYAKQNNLPVALVPAIPQATSSSRPSRRLPPPPRAWCQRWPRTDYRISIVNGPRRRYPISSFTWLLVYETPPDAEKGRTIVDFLRWMYSVGQNSAAALDYAPAGALSTRLTDRLRLHKVVGQPVTSIEQAPGAADSTSPATTLEGKSLGDRIYRTLTTGCAVAIPVLLAFIAFEVVAAAWPALRQFGFGFLTSSVWDPVRERFGAAPMIYGTIVSSLVALILAAPLALGVAIWLSEFSPRWLRTPVSFLVDLLAAIPSVVYGLWGIFVLLPILRESVMPFLATTLGLGHTPFFSGPTYGNSMLAASVILAIMILPYISAVSREVLMAVPRSQREAALAMGATKWEMIRDAVIPYARSGILGGVILGLGRALGETMAVTMLIGNRHEISTSLFAPGYTLASVIAMNSPGDQRAASALWRAAPCCFS